MTKEEFGGVAAYLSAAAGKPMSREQAEVYFDLLADLPAELVKAAVKRALCESRYPTVPPVGVIRALAAELSRGEVLSWPDAWALACRAAAGYGLSRREKGLASLPAPARRAALAIGWQCLCDATEGDMDTLRAQFRDAYSVTAQREERDRLLPPQLRAGEVARLTEGVGRLPAPGEDELPF